MALVQHLHAVTGFLESARGHSSFDELLAGQYVAMKERLLQVCSLSIGDAAEVMRALTRGPWTTQQLAHLEEIVQARVHASTKAARNKQQHMAYVEDYLTPELWECLRSSAKPNHKIDRLVGHVCAFGLRHPHEVVVKKDCGLALGHRQHAGERLSRAAVVPRSRRQVAHQVA